MSLRSILHLAIAVAAVHSAGMAQTPPATPPPPAQAQAAPAPAAVITTAKLAWLNLEEAIFRCEEGRREFGEVQKFVDKKNQELQAAQKDLEALRNQLFAQAAKLTDEARADLEEQIDARETGLQRFQQDTQREIDARRVRTTNMIGRKMLPILEKFSKEKGLSAVLYLNSSRDGWVDPALVITEEIIKAYNQAYPPGAASTPGTAQKP